MEFRQSDSSAIVLFGGVVARGLAALLFTNAYVLKPRVGWPLYTQINLGNDLIANIAPSPTDVLEAYRQI